MDTEVVQLRTTTGPISDISQHVAQFCRDRGEGLCHVFVPHATAGVALIETGSGSESDLEDAMNWLLPRDDIYRYSHAARFSAAIMSAAIVPAHELLHAPLHHSTVAGLLLRRLSDHRAELSTVVITCSASCGERRSKLV